MNTILVAASVDLGVAADGARLGPKTILNHFHHQKSVSVEADPSIIKSRDKMPLLFQCVQYDIFIIVSPFEENDSHKMVLRL